MAGVIIRLYGVGCPSVVKSPKEFFFFFSFLLHSLTKLPIGFTLLVIMKNELLLMVGGVCVKILKRKKKCV